MRHAIKGALRWAVDAARKAASLTAMRFRRYGHRLWTLPRTGHDYLRDVGDGTGSSTVMAPLLWICRTFPEAPPALWREDDDGQEIRVRQHPLLRLLARPNRYYTGPVLWMATLADWNIDGNAYWLKVRGRAGQVLELWWVPHWMIEPRGDAETFVAHYEYRVDGHTIELRPEDVVHFRFGLDAGDARKGISPLRSVLREVATDDEAANFTASLLRNMGVPGLVIAPKEGRIAVSPEQIEQTRDEIEARLTGDARGRPLIMRGPTQIEQFGWSPEQLVLREIRRIPEERVCAVLGIPAIVAGLGAGLDRSTFTNAESAKAMAYETNILPTQRLLAEEIRWQLLPEWEREPERWRVGFDLSGVRVLQEDVYRLAQRHALAVREGCEMVSEFRRALGLPVVPERDNVFLRPLNVQTVRGDLPAPSANGSLVRALAPSADR